MTQPTHTPPEPTREEIAATTERIRRERAEAERRDRIAAEELAARSKETARAVLATAERLAATATRELADEAEAAWENLPEHRRDVVYPRDFQRDIVAEHLLEQAAWKIDDVQDRAAMFKLRQFVESGHRVKPTLILTGNTGAGKTCTAIAAGRDFLAQGKHVRMVSQRAYLDSQRPDRDNRDRIAKERFAERMKAAEVLIFDDLGADLPITGEQVRPFVLESIVGLLGSRADSGRVTIITTNLSSATLRILFDDRFVSRLGMSAVGVKLVGEDLRRPIEW